MKTNKKISEIFLVLELKKWFIKFLVYSIWKFCLKESKLNKFAMIIINLKFLRGGHGDLLEVSREHFIYASVAFVVAVPQRALLVDQVL